MATKPTFLVWSPEDRARIHLIITMAHRPVLIQKRKDTSNETNKQSTMAPQYLPLLSLMKSLTHTFGIGSTPETPSPLPSTQCPPYTFL
ncbi:unnamed protein product [Fusarium graminearum]|nr:unnamed protein product [Fusarium graminearum]